MMLYEDNVYCSVCKKYNSITTFFPLKAGPSSGITSQESTAQLLVLDPNLIQVLVKFLSGTNPHGTNQHSPQVTLLNAIMV